MSETLELEDLIAEQEDDELGNLHPSKFAAFAGRVCLLFGFIVGMQMPGSQVWWLTIAAVVGLVFFCSRALLFPHTLMRQPWTSLEAEEPRQ